MMMMMMMMMMILMDMIMYGSIDLCEWTFGTTYLTANGAQANMKLGGRDFLIQQNWILSNNQGCVKGYLPSGYI